MFSFLGYLVLWFSDIDSFNSTEFSFFRFELEQLKPIKLSNNKRDNVFSI